jgi:hypothetical protein
MVLAKKLKRLVRRWNALVGEGVDSRLPCRHAVFIVLSRQGFDARIESRDGIGSSLYNADNRVINQERRNGT